ncbi:MAG: TonB-dependent receptor domain-containing protein, partial [Steroidobacteraceae bacterium]
QDYTYNATGNSLVFRNSTGNRDRAFEVAGVEPRLRALWAAGGVKGDLEVGVRAHGERARDQYVAGSSATSRTGAIRDDEIRTGVALSAFAQNRIRVTEALHVTPGVRFERFTFERNILRMRVRRTTPSGSVTRDPEDVDVVSRDRVAEVIPGIGATWAPNERVTAFVGVHRGFAPPRTKDAFVYEDPTLAPNAQVPSPVTLQLDAERSWNYELGARMQPARFLSLELTAFYLDFSNQIIEPSLSAGSVAQASLANQGQTRHRGVEAGFSLDIGKAVGASFSLVASANHTYVDAAFAGDRFLRTAGGDTVTVRGNALPYAPRSRSNLALQFEHPLGVDVRLSGTFVGHHFADNFETAIASAN